MWTSCHQQGYLCLTAHYINVDWKLCKQIISFKMVESPHTGYIIGNAILESLQEWNITNKIVSLTLDNASNNDIATTFLSHYFKSPLGINFRIRCCAHILNLIVQDGLSILFESISKLRALVRNINSSQHRHELYFKCCKQLHKKKKNIRIDLPHRWNSTYEMLKVAVAYKEVLNLYCIELHNNSRHVNIESLNELDWTYASVVRDFLNVFDISTKDFCTVYTSSICHVIPNLLNICYMFNNYSSVDIFKSVIEKMKEKFNKYFDDLHITFLLGLFFDPRYKNHYFDTYLDLLYDSNTEKINNILTSFNSKLYEIYNFYKKNVNISITSFDASSSSSSTCSKKFENFSTSQLNVAMLLSKRKKIDSSKNLEAFDLKSYMDLPTISLENPEPFNILEWWKLYQNNYPILSLMARDILTIPVSTVASESAFSAGGRVISDTRSNLSPSTVEALICLKDWDLSERRMQEEENNKKIIQEREKLKSSMLEFKDNSSPED